MCISFLEQKIHTINGQELGVNIAKSTNTVVGAVGAVLTFTPLFPVGIILDAVALFGGFAIMGGDKIADIVRKNQFIVKMDEYQSAAQTFNSI